MSFETIKVEHNGPQMLITLNRPKQLNALSKQVLTELKEVLIGLSNQSSFETKGVLITGEGEKAFIAGADIKEMSGMSPQEGEAFGKLGQEVSALMEGIPVPIVACVNGFALGGGCEMAMACDFIYATDKAVFGQPEVALGLIPGFGGCVRLSRFVGPGHAKELIYTGRKVKAAEALSIGLVNAVFSSKEEMLEAARKTLSDISSKSPVAVGICKDVINNCNGKSTIQALELEASGFRKSFESEDKKEGTAAFVEKRVANFPGR